MNEMVREDIEKNIIICCINSYDNYVYCSNNDITYKDFDNKLYKLIFNILDNYQKDNYEFPSLLLIKQNLISALYDKKCSKEQTDNIIKEFDDIASIKILDDSEFKKEVEYLLKFKKKKQIRENLNKAVSFLNADDVDRAEELMISSYIENAMEKSKKSGDYVYVDMLNELLEKLNPYSHKEKVDSKNLFVPTGIKSLDEKYLNGGIMKGNIVLIAGRPGSGKTVVIKHMARNSAIFGKNISFFSLEMTADAIIKSYASQIARVDYGKVLREMVSEDDYKKLLEAMNLVTSPDRKLKNLYFHEATNMKLSKFAAKVIENKRRHNIDGLYLDYLQLLRMNDGRPPEKESDYALISDTVTTIVKALNISAGVAAQLNRECEKRDDKHPILSDLRSSGQFEQDAATVVGAYRDEYYNKEKSKYPNIMDLDVLKNRFGPCGRASVFFEGVYQSIGNI